MSLNTVRPLTGKALALGLIFALSACDSQPPGASGVASSPAPTPAPAPSNKPALGEFGLDVAGMDPTIAAGDDFYLHVNGNWMKTTEIPSDRSRYSMFAKLSIQAMQDTRTILEEAAADADASGERRKIGDFYSAFMDEAGIEQRGMAPIQPELDAINALADKQALARALGASLRADVDLLNATDLETDRLFGLWVAPNLLKPGTYVGYLVQGGLGMPDRDFYLEDGRMAELRQAYRTHIERVLGLAGSEDAKARAERILALETAIARAHATQLESNDVEKGANAWPVSEFAARAPGMDWAAFFAAAGLEAQGEFIVWQPQAVAGISALVESQDLQSWKDYLAFHAIERASPYLPKAFAAEHFAFHENTLSGTPEQSERWKRAVEETNAAIGEAVGKIYVESHFTPETKARANAMVENLLRAFDKRIDALDWMADSTKASAKAKLAGMTVGMGYPDHWRDYSGLEIRRDDALGNVERAGLFEYRRNLSKLGQAIDRDEWFMLPQTVNALNVPLENRLIFPAAILQAPFFDGNADDAINYGAIGGVIGHEISHSFDNMGALFDAQGKLSNWWTAEDLTRFNAAGAALAAQFSGYRPFPDLAVNGELTLGENIADVAGLATAFDAYRAAHANEAQATLGGFTPDQRFFLGWAQAWRGKTRESALRNQVLTNVHAPGHYRALTVRNLDGWYTAFSVKPGQGLYLEPQQRVKVW